MTKRTFQTIARLACIAGVVGLLAAQARAQEPAAPETMKPVIVTGTHLDSEDAAGSLTVTPIDLAEPQNVGYPTIADVLRVKATQYAGGTGVVNPGFGNGGDGSAQVSLRGLPANATLLLVNGRRTSTSDLNLIPEAAIKSIEILNDGASIVYGSDAVAGVVNVILYDEFSGAKVGAYYLNTTETDISDWKVNALIGETTEKASFVASVEYARANEQFSMDRERSQPQPWTVSGTSNPGRFNAAGVGTGNIALRWYVDPQYSTGLTDASQIPAGFDPVAYVAGGTSARNAEEAYRNSLLPANSPVRYGANAVLAPGFDPGFPYGNYTYAYRPHEKYAGYFNGNYKIFGENLEFFVQGYYAANSSANALAPSPLSGRTVSPDNYWYQKVFPAAASNGIPLTVAYRPVEAGPRVTYTDFENIHMVSGLKGRIGQSSWRWETAFLYDRTEIDDTQTGGILADVYDALLADSTPAAWNPFGYTPIGGSSSVNSPATVASMTGQATTKTVATTASWDAVVKGDIWKLPGGELKTALGVQFIRDELADVPDYAIQNGSVFPFNTAQPLYATRDTWGYFGELQIPIFGEDFNFPGVRGLSVSPGIRYQDFSDVGDTGWKPRVSFRWQPFDKQFAIKGSYAEGFIAPGFYDLYLLPGQDFTELYNPYTGTREQPSEAVLTIGNPDLKPSEAQTMMIGGTYEPDGLKGLTLSVDYYKIEQTGVPFQSAQYIVNEWYNWNPNNPYDPTNPYGPNAGPSAANPLGAQVELDETGELLQVRNVGPINTGERSTDGIDMMASYRFETGVGDFTLAGQATYILSYEQENFPGSGSVDYLGRYWGPGSQFSDTSFPEWRANVTLSYEYKRWTAAFVWNYVCGYWEDPTQQDWAGEDSYTRNVPDYNSFDFRLGWKIPKVEADLMVGMNNIFDEQPPAVESSFENVYDRRVGDIRGRMWFVSLTKQF